MKSRGRQHVWSAVRRLTHDDIQLCSDGGRFFPRRQVQFTDFAPCRTHGTADRGERQPPPPRLDHDGARGASLNGTRARARPRRGSGLLLRRGCWGREQEGPASCSRGVPGRTRGLSGDRPPHASSAPHLCPKRAPATAYGGREHQSLLYRQVTRLALASFHRPKPVT